MRRKYNTRQLLWVFAFLCCFLWYVLTRGKHKTTSRTHLALDTNESLMSGPTTRAFLGPKTRAFFVYMPEYFVKRNVFLDQLYGFLESWRFNFQLPELPDEPTYQYNILNKDHMDKGDKRLPLPIQFRGTHRYRHIEVLCVAPRHILH
eukprot:Selendium_serpulae@DN5966_c1_g1_i10.p3